MTLKIADRVFETTTTTGTGALTLSGAVQGFQSFSVIGNGIKTPYYIDDADSSGIAQNWEAGMGTVTISGGIVTLARNTIFASSNSNIAVNFGIGIKNVRGGVPAAMLPIVDENLNPVMTRALNTTGSTTNAHAIALPYTPIAYSDGMEISYRIPATNTTAGATVNVNGKGAIPLKYLGVDPGIGMLTSGLMLKAIYNSVTAAFDIVNITKIPVLPPTLPAGSVLHYAAGVAPTGFLKANGAAVSRSTYADLFTAIGTFYGVGDGSTTFNLPDLRGEFIRGFDDTRGVDAGRTFGSLQVDAFQGHDHLLALPQSGGTALPITQYWVASNGRGAATSGAQRNASSNATVSGNIVTTGTIGADGAVMASDRFNGSPRFGPETRPRNVALMACIKF